MGSSKVFSGTGRSPLFLRDASSTSERNSRRLIVIQLNGGNDGLNTIIPYRNDIYYKHRPTLGIRKNKTIDIDGDVGFNLNMRGIADLFHEGYVSVINRVGYPNATRSHFKSMDFWQSGGDYETGWLGRFLDNYGSNSPEIDALEVSDILSRTLRGEHDKGLAFDNFEELYKSISGPNFSDTAREVGERLSLQNENLEYIYDVLDDSRQIVVSAYEKYSRIPIIGGFPDTPFGTKLQLAARMIAADIDTKIYYVSHGTFDTHVGQGGKHNKLLRDFAEGIHALVQALKKYDKFKNTCILVFSEFGRRVSENASKGTDHGRGNSMYVITPYLSQPGFYNPYDNLQNLVKGDLPFEVDFRQIYATILEDWMEVDSSVVLKTRFNKLNLFNTPVI